MNQRLLERLIRHGEFPQLRPSATGSRSSRSVEPFGAAEPRLALSKTQRVSLPTSSLLTSSKPVEAEPTTEFTRFPQPDVVGSPESLSRESGFSDAGLPQTQGTQFGSLPSDAALEETQLDGAAFEDFTVATRSNFSESPFAPNPPIVPLTNTETTITSLTSAPVPSSAATNFAANPRQLEPAGRGNATPSRLEPMPHGQNSRLGTEGRWAEAQRVSSTPPVATTSASRTQPASPGNTEISPSEDSPRFLPPEPTQPATLPEESAEFSAEGADLAGLSSDRSLNPVNAEMPFQSNGEAIQPSLEPALEFDRRAAMLELRELGVKVRVTLSNAALKTQLEMARTAARLTETAVAATVAAEQGRTIDRTNPQVTSEQTASAAFTGQSETAGDEQQISANLTTSSSLEARSSSQLQSPPVALSSPSDNNAIPSAEPRLEGNISATPNRGSLLSDSSAASLLRTRVTPDSPTLVSVNANRSQKSELESVRTVGTLGEAQPRNMVAGPPDESASVRSSTIESAPRTLAATHQSSDSDQSIAPLEVNSTLELIAGNASEPAVYGTVAAVEVYNPPNRRAAVTRPKVTEAPKNEAEVLFSSLPDSNPLEWLSRLNSVQALDADILNVAGSVSQVRPLPAQSSPAQSSPIQSSPIQSNPGQSNPTQTSPVSSNTSTVSAQLGATLTSAVSANAPLLPNLEVAGRLGQSQLESVRPAPLVAPPGAGQPENSPSAPVNRGASNVQPQAVDATTAQGSRVSLGEAPQAVGGFVARQGNVGAALSGSEAGSAPTSVATQRQVASNGDVLASQLSDQRPATPEALREAALSNEMREPTTSQSSSLEIPSLERTDLKGTAVETNAGPLEEGAIVRDDVRHSSPLASSEVPTNRRDFNGDSALRSELREPASSSAALSSTGIPNAELPSAELSSTVLPSGITSSLGERSADTALNASAATSQTVTSKNAVAPQGMVAAVEVYNPPNRRATVTRPKVTEAPKNEAEVLFSSLPDSNPLEWLSRLSSVQALDVDAGSALSAPVLPEKPRTPEKDALRAADRPDEAPPLAAGQTGRLEASNLTTPRVAPNIAQTGAELRNRAVPDLGQRAEAQMRGSTLEPVRSGTLPNAQRLEQPNAQIGGAEATSALIATPPPQGTARPVQLSSSAQRLIAPITGIDPNTVQIRRDAESDALTKLYRADALAVNGTVLLSARLNAETPETLGVIAHELTHVARERQPRFVPPALRQAVNLSSATNPSAVNRTALPSLESQDEESIALQVEGFTRALAQQGMAISNSMTSNRSANGAAAPKQSRSLESVPWANGVLPAPWELADRLEALSNPSPVTARPQSPPAGFQQPATPQFTAARSDPSAFANSPVNLSQSTGFTSSGAGGIGGFSAPSTVRAAEQGRNVATPAPEGPLPKAPEATQKLGNGTAPAPDLDDLARQVYAVLKRRLITERRRSS